jgi:nucleotide-binding universal stress UspA family protein
MAGQILVPLRGTDRIEFILPYLEKIAQPGGGVVFLVHYGLDDLAEVTRPLLLVHTDITEEQPRGGSDRQSISHRRTSSPETEIVRACRALREKGVELSVAVFAGSLNSAVCELAQKSKDPLVLLGGARGNRFTRLFRKMGSFFKFLRPEMLPPVLLFQPSSFAGRPR